MREGFFLTGDLAHRDDAGRIVIDGRLKTVIDVAGHKVFPEEVAAVLDQHPAVLRSRVFTRPHPQMGEVVHAEVQLRDGFSAGVTEEILTFCRKRLSSHKIPTSLSRGRGDRPHLKRQGPARLTDPADRLPGSPGPCYPGIVQQPAGYKLVKLARGAWSVHSLAFEETFHPGIGPAAEAEALYVRQVRLIERARQHTGEFVIWDVGLGAAANALAVLHATREAPCSLRLVSFDSTLEPLEFALQHREALGYFRGSEAEVERLARDHRASFKRGPQNVQWELRLSDFPSLLAQPGAAESPNPI